MMRITAHTVDVVLEIDVDGKLTSPRVVVQFFGERGPIKPDLTGYVHVNNPKPLTPMPCVFWDEAFLTGAYDMESIDGAELPADPLQWGEAIHGIVGKHFTPDR